jgi:guanylate kinase
MKTSSSALPSPPAAKPAAPPLLILISAPSGAGKTTLVNLLLASQPQMTRAITCTTRAPRVGEQAGVDYYFLTVPDFQQRIAAGLFIEHAQVYDNYYGLLKSELLDKLRAGRDVLLNVDVQGAAAIQAQAAADPELSRALVTIFLCAESVAVLAQRLCHRGADTEAVIERRLAVARQEIAQWKTFDYLVTSGLKEEDLRRTLAIIEAEKMRSTRSAAPEF